MSQRKIEFTNREGHQLASYIDLPPGKKPHAWALLAHCFTCTKNFHAVANISRALTVKGYGVLRFDFTGLGESEGDFSETNFTTNVTDLICAAEFLEAKYVAPQLLIGHSLGGAAVLMAAKDIPSAKAVVTIGAPSEPGHVIRHFEGDLHKIENYGEARINIGGRSFLVREQFVNDLKSSNMQSHIKELKRALLIMHSPSDHIVGINNARDIYKAARHPKSFISLHGSDHLLTEKKYSHYAAEIISTWAEPYIAGIRPQKKVKLTDKQVVAKTGTEHYTTEIELGNHAIIADEPEDVGGNDYGPSPYDLLAAALGSCTSMTLRMYADHKKWPLEEVLTHVQHRKIHAEDCKDCEEKDKKIDQLEREIEVRGPLDDNQKKRLLEIANKCPVHKTLSSKINITSKLRSEEDAVPGE